MIAFIDLHRAEYGVEPICRHLPIAPSTFRERKRRERDSGRVPARTRRDAELIERIRQVHRQSSQYLSIRYSERLQRAGVDASCGTVGDSYD